MQRVLKAVSLGIITALLGAVVYFLLSGFELEENLGLDVLFKLRGKIEAPKDTVIIAIDKTSSDHFDLPNDPAQWPRQLHAQLIERLAALGARVIVFDIFFKEARDKTEDQVLAAAIKRAGNVILFTHLQRDILSEQGIAPDRPDTLQAINIERLVLPTPVIANAPVALAPFALLKYPQKITKFWTFRVPAGEIPNLPAITLQLYNLDAYPALHRLIQRTLPEQAQHWPATVTDIRKNHSLSQLVGELRYFFKQHPSLVQHATHYYHTDNSVSLATGSQQKIQSLLNMYAGPNQHYLNFYGPPRSITTIPYHEIIEPVAEKQLDLANKVVFVGFSEFLQPEQKDNFFTVFSLENGVDLSGVEIGATAFSNLLYDQTIKPLSPFSFIALIMLYGFVIASISKMLPTLPSIASALAIATGYAAVSYFAFRDHYLWLPWVVPLLIQTPFALFIALLWHYFETRREREQIREAFGFYLPTNVVDKISHNLGHLETIHQQLYGICLATDAEQYTRLAEQLSPEELSDLINKYYQLLFEPVRQHDGIISDVVGDAMLAIWSSPDADVVLRTHACEAALEITHTMNSQQAINNPVHVLPTRIGLHAGVLMLGNVGAMDHYEYRAVGDIVNTSNRIQALNKTLGSNLIASENAVEGVSGIVMRQLGAFQLPGKQKSIRLFELLCRNNEVNEEIQERCNLFAEGLEAFQSQSWDIAIEIFSRLCAEYSADKPAQFYLQYCLQHKDSPPSAQWDGVISLNNK